MSRLSPYMNKEQSVKYLPNRERDLLNNNFKRYDFYVSCSDPDAKGGSYGTSNPMCKIKSGYCSKMMAPDVPTDMPGICEFHRSYMSASTTVKCGCREFRASCGDRNSTWTYREYYDLKGPYPMVDPIGTIYCCSNCSNYKKKNRFMCGEMNVCPNCTRKHDETSLISNVGQ